MLQYYVYLQSCAFLTFVGLVCVFSNASFLIGIAQIKRYYVEVSPYWRALESLRVLGVHDHGSSYSFLLEVKPAFPI